MYAFVDEGGGGGRWFPSLNEIETERDKREDIYVLKQLTRRSDDKRS